MTASAAGNAQSQLGEIKAEYRKAIIIRTISTIVCYLHLFSSFVVLIITHNCDMSMTNPVQQKEILGLLRGLHTRDGKRQAVACAIELES